MRKKETMMRFMVIYIAFVFAGLSMMMNAGEVNLNPPSEAIKSDTAEDVKQSVVWKIKKHNGVSTLHKNGVPVMLNMVYDNDSEDVKYTQFMSSIFSQKDEANIHMHHLGISVDWKNPDNSVRYHEAIRRIKKLLEVDPDGYVLFRVFLWPPGNWAAKYPHEMVLDENGNMPDTALPPVSMSSEFYISMASDYLRKMVAFLEKSPYGNRIIGYQPCIGETGETNAFRTRKGDIADYSFCAQKAFRKYLFEKYKTIESINSNLKTDFQLAEDVKIPAEKNFCETDSGYFKNPLSSKYTSDYYDFATNSIADVVIELCKAIKQEAPNKLAGTYYGGIIQSSMGGTRPHLQNSILSWKRLAASPYFDFVISPGFYRFSGLAGAARVHGLLAAMDLYDKSFILEYDRPTHLLRYMDNIFNRYYIKYDGFSPLRRSLDDLEAERRFIAKSKKYVVDFEKNYRDYFVQCDKQQSNINFIPASDRAPSNMNESIALIRRWIALCTTEPTMGIIWWDQEGCKRKATGGLVFNHPLLMAELRKADELFKKALGVKRKSRAQAAVFYDCESLYYRGANNNDYIQEAFLKTTEFMGKSGIPFDEYFFDNIEDIPDLQRYKLIILPDTNYLTKAKREWIEKNLKKDGRTIVWFFGSGLIDENSCDVRNMEQLTGIKFKEEKNSEEYAACRINDFKSPITESVSVPESMFGAFSSKVKLLKPWFSIDDADTVILGKSLLNDKAVFGIKRFSDWTSIYVPCGPLPIPLIKNIAKNAQVNVYTDADDILVWANESMISVYAFSSVKGLRKINFPKDIKKCTEFYSNKQYVVKDGGIEVDFNDAPSCLVFFVE